MKLSMFTLVLMLPVAAFAQEVPKDTPPPVQAAPTQSQPPVRYTITFTQEELNVVGEGLGEIAAKRALPILQTIQQQMQLQMQARAKAAEIKPGDAAKPAVPPPLPTPPLSPQRH